MGCNFNALSASTNALLLAICLLFVSAVAVAVLPVVDIDVYSKRVTKELNEWLDDVDLKVSATHYTINRNCPLYLVKLSFGNKFEETK